MNRNFTNMTDDLLVKYLLGEVNTEEITLVDQWVAESKANKKHFEHFKLIWQESKKLEAKSTVDVDAAWGRFQNRIATEQAPAAKTIPLGRSMSWQRVAAVLLVVLCCSWFVYYFASNRSDNMVAIDSGEETITGALPDGSFVVAQNEAEAVELERSPQH
ncbi:MAG: hypothetical protein EOP51_30805, partial [Sphingobacteriales bacterium]